MKKTTKQFQVHVHAKPVHTFQLRILNWKLESVTKFRFPRPILSFPVSVCYVTSFSNWKTGKLEKLEKCKQCLVRKVESERSVTCYPVGMVFAPFTFLELFRRFASYRLRFITIQIRAAQLQCPRMRKSADSSGSC